MAWNADGYNQHAMTCNPAASTPQPPYSVIQSDVNNGYAYYQALDVNLSHRFHGGLSMLVSYTWSHTIDNVDLDVPSQNPNDPNVYYSPSKRAIHSCSQLSLWCS